MAARDDTEMKVLAAGGGACGLVSLGLAIFVMVSVYNFLSSCGEAPPPTPEEIKKLDREIAIKEERRIAFERQQKPLWQTSKEQVTEKVASTEVSKCLSDIRKNGSKSPYALMFDASDPKTAANSIREGLGGVTIYAQQKAEVFDKVMVTKYSCNFKGIGYENFREIDTKFIDKYIP